MLNKSIIFTDGACSGNPGPGGWGAIVVAHQKVTELGGGSGRTTNNQMEMQSVIEALRFVDNKINEVNVYTDSVYVIRGITQWIWGWKKNNWLTAEGQPVLNKEHWLELDQVVSAVKKFAKINWHYVRGHTGVPGNERCDQIAVSFSQKTFTTLYKGSLKDYSIEIEKIPADTSLPEMKPRSATEKKAAYYLCYMNGVVHRYKTWPECEQAVKGKSGAKYKKITDPSEEPTILKSWQVPGTF